MKISEAHVLFDKHELLGRGAEEKTRKNYRTAVNSLIRVIGDVPIQFLGIDHIVQYKIQMRQDGNKNTSINSNLSRLRQILKFLQQNEFPSVLDYRKIQRDKEVREPHVVLNAEEVGLLIKHAKTLRDKAIIQMYFGTGCRLSEILDLDREAFEQAPLVADGVYEVWVCGKGKKYRPVCFAQGVKDAVDAYLETRDDYFRPLFMSNQNRRLGGSRVEKMLHEVTRASGLKKNVTPHTMRHSFITDMAAKNAPIPTISNLVGHANASTTLRIYTHIQQSHSREAYAKFHSNVQ